MTQWHTVNCRHCGGDIHVHEDWDREPEYHKECAWVPETCGICGGEMMVHRSWENPPTAHKECRQKMRDKWKEKSCGRCGASIKYHEDWEKVPDLCNDCRERERVNWRKKSCNRCGKEISYHRDWGTVPSYCPDCLWYEESCFICNGKLRVRRDWDKPPKAHKDCLEKYRPKDVVCRECGNSFKVSTGLQLMCREKGYNIPTRCPQCKEDSLLISGALGAARDHFKFALIAKIEPRGLFFPEKVAVIYSKKTGEAVAEVKMENRGFIMQTREAILRDVDRNVVSRTREGVAGIILPERVANTYATGESGMTHRTRETTEGVFFPRPVRETRNLSTGDKTKVRLGTQGIFNPKSVQRT